MIYAVSGFSAGVLNGLFGAGGGLVLVPMLLRWAKLDAEKALPTSVAVILPLCVVSCIQRYGASSFDLRALWPYMAGGLAGGIAGGLTYSKMPKTLLRRILGFFILYAGVRMTFNL